MPGPSFGYTFKTLDSLFQPIKEKFGSARYENFYPFKSQSGKWYAFWNDSYADIKIWDVERKELVIDKFYSNLEEKVYAHHTNFSTYVPCYVEQDYEYQGKHNTHVVSDYEIDEWCEDGSIKDLTIERLNFLPVAFNAWTIWAADHEFYCDMIDLSRIDEGIISKFDTKGYILSRDIDSVRSVVKADTDTWLPVRQKDETEEEFEKRAKDIRREPVTQFKVLEEKEDFRWYSNQMKQIDMKETSVATCPNLPWEDLRVRIQEIQKKA